MYGIRICFLVRGVLFRRFARSVTHFFIVHFLLTIHIGYEWTLYLIVAPPPPQQIYAPSALICSLCDVESPDNGNVFCMTVELKSIEERQVINYLHKMVIMMVQEWEGQEREEDRNNESECPGDTSADVYKEGVTTEMPLAVNVAEYWHGSGQGVCSPDFITCVNIDFRCGCCYRRQVECPCASCLKTGRCLEHGCIDGASCLIATLH
jgi:hypothetical protein